MFLSNSVLFSLLVDSRTKHKREKRLGFISLSQCNLRKSLKSNHNFRIQYSRWHTQEITTFKMTDGDFSRAYWSRTIVYEGIWGNLTIYRNDLTMAQFVFLSVARNFPRNFARYSLRYCRNWKWQQISILNTFIGYDLKEVASKMFNTLRLWNHSTETSRSARGFEHFDVFQTSSIFEHISRNFYKICT